MSALTMNYPWPAPVLTPGYRQLDDGTFMLFGKKSSEPSLETATPPAGETRAARLTRELGEGLVGYAIAHNLGDRVIETWVLFKTFRSPAALSSGGWTGFEVRGVIPTQIDERLARDSDGKLPTAETFVTVVRELVASRGLDPIVLEAVVQQR